MAFSSRALLALAALSTASQARDFPDTAEDLYAQIDTHSFSEAETELALSMKESIIGFFDLKPIHVDRNDEVKSADEDQKPMKQKHGKKVEYDLGGLGWDFANSNVNDQNIGLSESASIEIALSWVAPVFLDIIDRFTLLSARPQFNLETLGDLSVTAHLNFIEITLSLKMYPFKFTPFDVLARMDTLHPNRYCFGFSYIVKTLLAQLMIETRVNECYWGVAGLVTENDKNDCVWRSYKPELPLYTLQVDNVGNISDSYINYQCMNWYSAEWPNWPLTPEYIAIHSNQ